LRCQTLLGALASLAERGTDRKTGRDPSKGLPVLKDKTHYSGPTIFLL
jgi:hypothetical protein